eukprot:TRINITY_DN5437_c0_g1_i1.p1 TRINITY_DN5437_c0_g1~~TRINITY_DN5437_c0_g1_i1.p1  ORF type:complete len:343 (-),score=46.88 TRINITY_DN5437_c0_g1_i1:92-1096(-)
MSSLAILKGVVLLFVGCFTNNFFLEMIIKVDPGCGPALTLCQFSLIVLTLLPNHITKPRIMPLWFYAVLTVMFFLVSYLNNLAFAFQISQPVHMVARSSSLAVSFFVGVAFFGSQFDSKKLFSIILVTLGILVTLSAEAESKAKKSAAKQMDSGCTGVGCNGIPSGEENQHGEDDLFYWGVGIAMLFVALILSAILGHFQSYGYRMWGKHSEEVKFYSHFFSLFGFLFSGQEIATHFEMWSATPPLVIPYMDLDTGIPKMWVWVFINALTQWVCVSGVYLLMSNTSAVTVTLWLTLRKFLSLIFSVWYFSNPFMSGHWFGVALVFAGAILYGVS